MLKYETSYGIIPLKKIRNSWKVLLVLHGKGHWAFPKGHRLPDEEKQAAAERELKEETGLTISQFLDLPEFQEEYFFQYHSTLIKKRVLYWAALVKGSVKIQEDEISDFRWLTLEQAALLATFAETKKICHELQKLLDFSRIAAKIPNGRWRRHGGGGRGFRERARRNRPELN